MGYGGWWRRGPVVLAVVVAAVGGVAGCTTAAPDPGPPLPPTYLGLDSYLHWSSLPYLEIGDRVGGQSTADPNGTNSDNVGTSDILPDGGRVLFDQAGPGVLTFLRMQQAIGAPWQLGVDGQPPTALERTDFGQLTPGTAPAASIPYPLSLNQTESQGSSILATSVPYAKGLRFTSSGQNGNFYSMFRRLPADAEVPHWTAEQTQRVAAMLAAAGKDPTPPDVPELRGNTSLHAGAPTEVTTVTGRQELRSITFRAPYGEKVRLGNARLRIFWDGEQTPSVDAPLKFLAGDGAGVYQPAGRDLVRALPSVIAGDGSTFLEYRLFWPMPFASSARIELQPDADITAPVTWSVRHSPVTDPPNWLGTFHANYTDVPNPQPGRDMRFLDFRGTGKLVGTVVNFGHVGGTLEGDPHVYLDDSRTPQISPTGTEEWGMGGDYWNSGNQTTLPLAGLPSSTNNPPGSDVDGAAEYRFLIADSVPFNDHIVVDWEHGGRDESTERYRATMLWYGTPATTTVPTDQVVPGNPDSASAHSYDSTVDRKYLLTSGFEYTVNSPQTTGTVLATSSGATFTMALRPDNVGAFLRRTYDSCVPGQRADVLIDGHFAGTWYNPGASRTPGPNRCWRDDDLPLPRALTAGKHEITIRIADAAPDPHVTPWTAASYQLFAFTRP